MSIIQIVVACGILTTSEGHTEIDWKRKLASTVNPLLRMSIIEEPESGL